MYKEVENLRSRHKQDWSRPSFSASSLSFDTRLATNGSTRVMRHELAIVNRCLVYVTAGQSTHPSVEERNEMIVVRNRDVNNLGSFKYVCVIQGSEE